MNNKKILFILFIFSGCSLRNPVPDTSHVQEIVKTVSMPLRNSFFDDKNLAKEAKTDLKILPELNCAVNFVIPFPITASVKEGVTIDGKNGYLVTCGYSNLFSVTAEYFIVEPPPQIKDKKIDYKDLIGGRILERGSLWERCNEGLVRMCDKNKGWIKDNCETVIDWGLCSWENKKNGVFLKHGPSTLLLDNGGYCVVLFNKDRRTSTIHSCSDAISEKLFTNSRSEIKMRFLETCRGGDQGMCANINIISEDKDKIESVKELFRTACDLGEIGGCYNLGLIEKHKGEINEARKYLRKTCNLGWKGACISLGRLEYDQGNKDLAKKIFKQACESGAESGCVNLKSLEE